MMQTYNEILCYYATIKTKSGEQGFANTKCIRNTQRACQMYKSPGFTPISLRQSLQMRLGRLHTSQVILMHQPDCENFKIKASYETVCIVLHLIRI